jgi:hypothetical protein
MRKSVVLRGGGGAARSVRFGSNWTAASPCHPTPNAGGHRPGYQERDVRNRNRWIKKLKIKVPHAGTSGGEGIVIVSSLVVTQ